MCISIYIYICIYKSVCMGRERERESTTIQNHVSNSFKPSKAGRKRASRGPRRRSACRDAAARLRARGPFGARGSGLTLCGCCLKLCGLFSGCLGNKRPTVWGSLFGAPDFWKLPFGPIWRFPKIRGAVWEAQEY